MIIEYKKHLCEDGRLRHPPFAIKRGFLYNPSNKTFIGFCPSSSNREWKLPDSIVEYDQAGLIARVQGYDPSITDEEIISVITDNDIQ